MQLLVNFGVGVPDARFASWPLPSFLVGKDFKYCGQLYSSTHLALTSPRPVLCPMLIAPLFW